MILRERYADSINEAVAVCGLLSDRGYVTAEGGNLAVRLEENLLLITPTRLNKGLIRDCDMVFIDMEGRVLESERKSTGETPMYLSIFNRRPDVSSIIHAHPPAACAFAVIDGDNLLMRPFYPEMIIDCGPVPVVPYAEPLTQQLADNFTPFLDKYNTFIMENHGVLVLNRGGIMETYGKLDLLEGTARSLLYAKGAGFELKEISRQEVENLERTMKTRGIAFTGGLNVVEGLEELYY
ncbi:MAG: class II aldolase/adducin family protein [bacterium]|nr:class II aldolase/adducin family protein [bacterium]